MPALLSPIGGAMKRAQNPRIGIPKVWEIRLRFWISWRTDARNQLVHRVTGKAAKGGCFGPSTGAAGCATGLSPPRAKKETFVICSLLRLRTGTNGFRGLPQSVGPNSAQTAHGSRSPCSGWTGRIVRGW